MARLVLDLTSAFNRGETTELALEHIIRVAEDKRMEKDSKTFGRVLVLFRF